jgi:hypothetical protein
LIARLVDLTVPELVHWLVGETTRHFGRLDICVANWAQQTLSEFRAKKCLQAGLIGTTFEKGGHAPPP